MEGRSNIQKNSPIPCCNGRMVRAVGGFTILESLLAMGIAAMLLIVIVGAFNAIRLQANSVNRTIARQLLIEESEALRSASFAFLENRTNTPFIEVAFNAGQWKVQAPSSPQSAPNVVTVQNVSGANNPSREVVPLGSVGNGTYETFFRVQNASAAGWKAGIYVRYHDERNYYLLQASSTALQLIRVIEGASTTLWSVAMTFTQDTWYQLTLAASGAGFDTFNVSVNNVLKTASPVTDTTFTSGQYLLAAFDGAVVDFDNVSFTGSVTKLWNFDGGQTAGSAPLGWRRIGPQDLPSGTSNISITDAVSGYTDLKQATIRVDWQERGSTRSLTNALLINQQSVLP